MQPLKQSTATEVTVGPAIAVGDGFTPVTTLTIAAADEKAVIKHGATTSVTLTGTLAAFTAAVDGYYHLDLPSGAVDTLGRLTLVIQDDSLILPIRQEFVVLPANVFDSLYGSDLLQVDLTQVENSATLPELSVGVPATTPGIAACWMLMYMAIRNKLDVTTGIKEVHNDAGTIVAKKLLTDDGSVYSEAKMISG